MYIKKTNTFTFPHIVPGNILGGREHSFNSINGGMIPVANLNIIQSGFLGGNCLFLGKIKEYGMWGCPHYVTKKIMGFYIDDPSSLTDLGKKLLQELYPTANIFYEKIAPTAVRQVTQEDIDKRKKKLAEAQELGMDVSSIVNQSIEVLDGLLAARQSGKVTKVSVEGPVASETKLDEVPVVKIRRRG